jgi:hypothetical protein
LGILTIPKGRFVPVEPEDYQAVFFGKTAARLLRIQEKMRIDPKYIIERAVTALEDVVGVFEAGGKLEVRAPTGETLESWSELAALLQHIKRDDELHGR